MNGNDHRKCVRISFTLPTTFMSSTSLTKFHQFGKIFICLINCIHVVYDINVIHMIIIFHHYCHLCCQFHPCLDITYPSTYQGIANVANHQHIRELPMLPTLYLGKMSQNMILICHMSQIQTSQHKFRIRSMASQSRNIPHKLGWDNKGER